MIIPHPIHKEAVMYEIQMLVNLALILAIPVVGIVALVKVAMIVINRME